MAKMPCTLSTSWAQPAQSLQAAQRTCSTSLCSSPQAPEMRWQDPAADRERRKPVDKNIEAAQANFQAVQPVRAFKCSFYGLYRMSAQLGRLLSGLCSHSPPPQRKGLRGGSELGVGARGWSSSNSRNLHGPELFGTHEGSKFSVKAPKISVDPGGPSRPSSQAKTLHPFISGPGHGLPPMPWPVMGGRAVGTDRNFRWQAQKRPKFHRNISAKISVTERPKFRWTHPWCLNDFF